MALDPASNVVVYRSFIGIDLFEDLVKLLGGGFATYGIQVGALKVFLAVVDIVGGHCSIGDKLLSYVDGRINVLA